MRTLRLPLLFIVLGVAAIAFLVYQFIVPRNTVVVPAEGGTYIEGVAGTPKHINPLLCQLNEADRDLCNLVFEGLTRLNEAGEAVPALAETWNISDNGITYTFKLRDDAKWEDGTPVTAADVVFTTALLRDHPLIGIEMMRARAERLRYGTRALEKAASAVEMLKRDDFERALQEMTLDGHDEQLHAMISSFVEMIASMQKRKLQDGAWGRAAESDNQRT